MRRSLLIALSLMSLSAHADNLLSLYQRAVLASPELKGSQYSLDIAKAQEDQALGRLLPQIAATGNYSGNNLKYETRKGVAYPGTRAGVNLRQPLFDLQAYLLMRSQESRTAQGEDALAGAHQKLIYDLVDRYVDALDAADKSEIINAELESTEKQLARVKAMSERQMALITDLYELQARVETLRTNLIESRNDANIALEKLRELTGDAVTSIQPVRLDTQQPAPEGSADAWVEQVSKANPDVSALAHAVEAADKSISAYQAGHLPRLEFQASGSYSDTVYNNQQSPAYTVGSIGVEATIPIFEGGITSARVEEAEGRKGLSSSQLEQKQRELEKYTRAAYLDMATAQARSAATDRQLDASEKAKLAMEKGYELGVVTIVDLLNAQKQLSESRKIQRQSRYRYFKSRSLLMMEAGQLDVEELAKLNDWLVSDTSLAISSNAETPNTAKTNKANSKEKPAKVEAVNANAENKNQAAQTKSPTPTVEAIKTTEPKPETLTPTTQATSAKPTSVVEQSKPAELKPEPKPVAAVVNKPSTPSTSLSFSDKPVVPKTTATPATQTSVENKTATSSSQAKPQVSTMTTKPATDKAEVPAATKAVAPVNSTATAKPAEPNTAPSTPENTVIDEKMAERVQVNETVQKFIHSDFKPVIKSVTNPYKNNGQNADFTPTIKPVTKPKND